MQLSPNFNLIEFTHSDTAVAKEINNDPSPEQLDNLVMLAGVLERVRVLLGRPIIITSGYRSVALNKIVKGALNSSHSEGLAADFHCPGFGSDIAVCHAIERSDIDFDQLIFEQALTSWVHFGIGPEMRRQVFSWRSGYGNRQSIVHIS